MCDLIIFIVQCSNGLCYVLYCEPINKITMKIDVSMFTCPNAYYKIVCLHLLV